MLVFSKKAGALVGLAAAAATAFAIASPAYADSGARSGDVVGVGSDTAQNIVDFVLDGSPGVAGGYNSQGNNNRVMNVFATGDANGRAVYDGNCGTAVASTGLAPFCDSTTNKLPTLEPGTVVLRDGTDPVTRPNGSGAGLAALTADGGSGFQNLPTGSIQFSRASRPPKSTEESACDALTNCGGLHSYRIATDTLGIATTTVGSNAPAGLSVAELVSIYECNVTTWNALPGNTSGSTETIHPLLPQAGSGTRSFFETALGISDSNLGSCVRSVEEHDPTGIYQDPTPKDAIEPFSSGKLALINSGYFQNPGYSGTGFANGAYTTGYLHLLAGTPPDAGTNYNDTRPIFVVIKQADLGSLTPFQPGGSQNWAQALFSTSGAWFAKSFNSGLFTAAGVTQAWKDCGKDMTEQNNPNNC
jgi:ABC-type phosphate transport system substrate-binding protein